MSADSADIDQIHKWVSKVFKSHCYKKIDVELTGTSEKGDGYVGNIAFIKVQAESSNGQKINYDLVVKYGKLCEKLRKDVPIKMAFEREILVYTQAIEAFRNIEKKRNLNIIDQFIPKCFGTFIDVNQEVIILQNLKSIGYSLNHTLKPLNLDHLIITMENYGRFHAYSLVLKQQNPEEFSRLFDGMTSVFKIWMEQAPNFLLKTEQLLYDILENNKEFDLLDRMKKRFATNFVDLLIEQIEMEKDRSVLIHGDCWNNNFMFKYHNNQPVSCKFLDFQNASLTSPICDLSYHLFATASELEFRKFDHLMQIYHQSLCHTSKQLGTDEEIFTYDDIICHWKKYSVFGFILASTVLIFTLGDKGDAIDIADFVGEHVDSVLDNLAKKNMERISPRAINMIKYFLNLELY